MNNTNQQITKIAHECLNILSKSIILNEYEKLDFHSRSTFRWILFGSRNDINLKNIIDTLPESDLNKAVCWLHEQSYYNSDEYQNSLLNEY